MHGKGPTKDKHPVHTHANPIHGPGSLTALVTPVCEAHYV